MDVHLRDLRYFVAVAEELSFTRAAQRLHLSQPALSKQIRGLERALHAQLFDRDRRRVRLTAAGEALLKSARQALADWERGTADVADVVATERRTLRVGMLTSIGRGLYRNTLDGFAERLPDWRVELRSFEWGDPTAGLNVRATDAAFLWLPVDADELTFTVVSSERRFVTMSNEHRLAGRSSVSWNELADEAFIALPHSAGPLREFWLGTDGEHASTVRVVAEVTNADEKLEIVSSGAAIGLSAEGNTRLYARSDITSVPVTDLAPARLAVAHRRGDMRQPVQAFVEACVDAAAQSPAI